VSPSCSQNSRTTWNPIEQVFATLKHLLHKEGATMREKKRRAMRPRPTSSKMPADSYRPDKCSKYFWDSGYGHIVTLYNHQLTAGPRRGGDRLPVAHPEAHIQGRSSRVDNYAIEADHKSHYVLLRSPVIVLGR